MRDFTSRFRGNAGSVAGGCPVSCSGGTVVTIEYDGSLARQAAANLRRAGFPDVRVITGGGALGYQPAAPYDGIIVTAEAIDVTAAWRDQLGAVILSLRVSRGCDLRHRVAVTVVNATPTA